MFDWQTEETIREPVGWDEPLPEPMRPPTRRPRWRTLAAIGLLTLIAGLMIWWQVGQRVAEATRVIEAEVIGSVNLVYRAVENGDEELFRSLLSGRSLGWTQATLDLFERDLVFDRRQLGMVAGPLELPLNLHDNNQAGRFEASAATSTVDIALSPDLAEAEVVGIQPYVVARAASLGGMETVWLRQTAVYRRGEQGWLLAPPLRPFWGEWQTVEGERLDVVYPERDAELAERLAADLDTLLNRACTQVADLTCPADWRVTLRLESDPEILVELNDRWLRRGTDGMVELPTPTLVGLPVEGDESAAEAGYQALLRMYGSRLLRSVLGELTGFNCCRQMLFYRVLVDRLLSELGVEAWPVSPDEYGRLLDEHVRLQDLEADWRVTEGAANGEEAEQLWRVYTLVDYLVQSSPYLSAVEMIGWLGRTDSLQDWLQNILMRQPGGNRGAVTRRLLQDFDRHWWTAAYQITEGDGDAVPEPLTDALYMSCISDQLIFQWQVTLSRLEPGSDIVEPMYRAEGYLLMLPTPGADELRLQEFGSAPGGQLKRWRNGELENISLSTGQLQFPFFDEYDPTGQRSIIYSNENLNSNQLRFLTYLLDFGRCEDGICSTTPIAGPVRWSPEGTRAISMVDDYRLYPMIITWGRGRWHYVPNLQVIARHPLYLGLGEEVDDMADAELIGEGYGPFWIDEQSYGFLRVSAPGEQEVVIGAVGEDEQQTLIRTADLRPLLPESSGATRFELIQVVPNPADPALLFLVVLDRATEQGYFFSIDRHTRQVSFRFHTDYNLHSLAIAPNGRHLVVTDFNERGAGSSPLPFTLFLHDIEDNQTTPFLIAGNVSTPAHAYDWSPDGKWLAFAPGENMLMLVAPDQGIVRQVAHEYGACNGIAWLDG